MTEAEEKVWRDAKNAEMRAKRKRNRMTTSALPLPSAPALAPSGWGEGWGFGPLPPPPGGPPLYPAVALNFLRNLPQPQQQHPLFQALPPPQLFPAPPPPQLSTNSQSASPTRHCRHCTTSLLVRLLATMHPLHPLGPRRTTTPRGRTWRRSSRPSCRP